MPDRLDPERLFSEARWVWRLARSLVDDDPTADDVVQDTWIAAIEHPPRVVPDDASLRAWLATVVRNFASRTRRADARRSTRERAAAREEADESVGRVVASEGLRRELVAAVLALPEPQRSTVVLRYFDELSSAEIARRLALPESTVRNRLRRGLAELRAKLERAHDGKWRQRCLFLIPTGHVTAGNAVGGGALAAGILATGSSVLGLVALLVALLAGLWLWNASTAQRDTEPRDALAVAGKTLDEPVRDGASGSPPNAEDGPSSRRSADVAPSSSTLFADLGGVAFGRVSDAGGRAVRRARIRWYEPSGAEHEVLSDERGWYSISDLGTGPWRIVADAPRHLLVKEAVEATSAGIVRRDLVLERKYRLAVRLRSPSGADLLEVTGPGEHGSYTSLAVVVTRDAPGPRLDLVTAIVPTTYGIGRYYGRRTFDVLGEKLVPDGCAGVVELEEPLPAYASLVLRDVVIETQRVEAGTEEITFTAPDDAVTSRLARARVRVVDEQELPIAGIRVTLEPIYLYGTGAITGTDGIAAIENVPPGPMVLRILDAEREPFTRFVDVAPGARLDLGVVRLASPARVRGRVIDENGRPVAATLSWSRLDVLDRAGGFLLSQRTQSSADGTFEIAWAPRAVLLVTTPRHATDAAVSAGTVVDATSGTALDVVVRVERPVVRVVDLAPPGNGSYWWRLVRGDGVPVDAGEVERAGMQELRAAAGAYTLEIVGAAGVVASRTLDLGADLGIVEVAW